MDDSSVVPHVPSTMAADAVNSVHGAYVRLAAHVKRAEALVHEARANSREIKNILEQQQLLTRQANDTAGKLRSELGQVKVRSGRSPLHCAGPAAAAAAASAPPPVGLQRPAVPLTRASAARAAAHRSRGLRRQRAHEGAHAPPG